MRMDALSTGTCTVCGVKGKQVLELDTELGPTRAARQYCKGCATVVWTSLGALLGKFTALFGKEHEHEDEHQCDPVADNYDPCDLCKKREREEDTSTVEARRLGIGLRRQCADCFGKGYVHRRANVIEPCKVCSKPGTLAKTLDELRTEIAAAEQAMEGGYGPLAESYTKARCADILLEVTQESEAAPRVCLDCEGTGTSDGLTGMVPCDRCGGSGASRS